MSADYLGMTLSTLCALLWATAVVLFKKSGEKVSPLSLNLVKNFVSVVLYTITLPLLGIAFNPDITLYEWILIAVSGVLGIGLGDAFFFAALNRLGASLTAIVDCLYSPFMILFSIVFLGEPFTIALTVGTAMVLGGLFLATNRRGARKLEKDRVKSKSERRKLLAGFAYGTIGIVAMAGSVVMVKPLLSKMSVLWVIWWRMLWGFLALVIWLGAHPKRVELARRLTKITSWRFVLSGGIVGGYFATIAWLYGMSLTNVSIASVLNQLSTLFIILLAALFLKEKMNRERIIAAFLGFGGACVIFFRHLFPF
jgi:drug/metabolite transporter (DMT)-like permease